MSRNRLSITRNADGEFVSDSKELGISCESCHGPGGQHVSAGGGKAQYIVNPKYLAADRVMKCVVSVIYV